jgi:hypothetical protein
VINIYSRIKKDASYSFKLLFFKYDIILIPVLFALLLLYIVPNGSGAGMMSDRYCLIFYMFLILWLACLPLQKNVTQIIMILVIVFHFGMLLKNHNGTIRRLNKDAVTIVEASKNIEPGSIVLPINLTDNWLEIHFSNYLGINSPLIILENYEVCVDWFPLKLNWQNLPKVQLEDKNSVSGLEWISNPYSNKVKQIDYIVLYGIISKIDDIKWQELKNELSLHYSLKYTSDNKYISLYKRNIF